LCRRKLLLLVLSALNGPIMYSDAIARNNRKRDKKPQPPKTDTRSAVLHGDAVTSVESSVEQPLATTAVSEQSPTSSTSPSDNGQPFERAEHATTSTVRRPPRPSRQMALFPGLAIRESTFQSESLMRFWIIENELRDVRREINRVSIWLTVVNARGNGDSEG
jgi:hypothetical protein